MKFPQIRETYIQIYIENHRFSCGNFFSNSARFNVHVSSMIPIVSTFFCSALLIARSPHSIFVCVWNMVDFSTLTSKCILSVSTSALTNFSRLLGFRTLPLGWKKITRLPCKKKLRKKIYLYFQHELVVVSSS